MALTAPGTAPAGAPAVLSSTVRSRRFRGFSRGTSGGPRASAPGSALRRRLTPWLFLIGSVGLLLVFTYWPAVNLMWYSFTDWDGLDLTKEYVGVANYVEVFTNPRVFGVFFVSLYYFAASFVQMAIALYFATILSFSTRFSNFFRGVLFFPYLINGVAIGFVFLYLFQPGGTLDTVLGWFGVADTPHWLGDPDVVNWSLAATSVWRYTGLNFVLFLGAIQSIPSELYEAADLDGANRFQQFRAIIFPGIRRVVGLSFILAIAGSLNVFEIPFIMTGGANGSATFVIQTLQTAFNFRQVGLASAMAVVLLVIVLVVTWIQRRVFPDEKVDLT
ncbi:multiple sugar transport system permease protein [Microbacterium terrae]|uniref:Sn-glycerol-3-phosphate transport system permease protein UgpA n=1 Tax=Microbacterium terrae TaxID=69369 RepID=A0A0M2HM44_9MICO|nr:sugar ABC transporter permease [Microbacterium terrae]KJL45495.1 sn-glycerol-3-phosphate transport system permease protein UgpA [Microbacterium terrae]MBP1078452.1 multiple sugar transport system permease protein [Microbacterium terrae]GLJ99352.1 ABC transporter permease [Microbacterium terrae]